MTTDIDNQMKKNSSKSNSNNKISYLSLEKEFADILLEFFSEIRNEAANNKERTVDLDQLISSLKSASALDIRETQHSKEFNDLFDSLGLLESSHKSSADLNKILHEMKTYIKWYPNNVYKDAGEAIKVGNYCANLVGKERECQPNPFILKSDDILVGLFLLGKGNLYPSHKHPAKEMWVILSGSAKWKRDGEDWLIRKPGQYFMHASEQSHAMQTLDEPLLAIWAWTGDLEKWAEWSEDE